MTQRVVGRELLNGMDVDETKGLQKALKPFTTQDRKTTQEDDARVFYFRPAAAMCVVTHRQETRDL